MPASSLQTVWATSGGLCGKYLASSMSDWLERMEAEGSLVQGRDRYSIEVRTEPSAPHWLRPPSTPLDCWLPVKAGMS